MLFCYKSCQVPREKRRAPSSADKATDLSATGMDSCRSLGILESHLQALRSMPVNLSLNTSTTEHQGPKRHHYGVAGATGEVRGVGVGGGGGDCALALVKTELQSIPAFMKPCAGAPHTMEQRDPIRMAYEQNHYDVSLPGYLKEDQRSTPDSTFEDSYCGGEVRQRGWCNWG